ncbi:PEP-CTERM sorting domain-containing protein [Desulfovulcanus sp.]
MSAHAVTIDLNYEFDGNSLGTTSFGAIDILQNGEDLDFKITANTINLNGGDIHEFYFNLNFTPTNLAITSSNAPSSLFDLIGPNPSISGGAGANFDWGVNFGNGASTSGNALLTFAEFTLSANEALDVTTLFEMSYPNNTPPVTMAVHFQNTGIFDADSETVGGNPSTPVPEPATMLLFGSGLAGLAGYRRKLDKKN